MQSILMAVIYCGNLLLKRLLALNLTNVLIQASYIFVLIKMIMFTQMLIDLLQRKMEGAAIMVKLLLLIKTVSSFGNSQRVKILIVGSIGVMLMIITIKSYYQLSAYEIRPDMKYRDTMYLIDKKTGQLINSIEVPPVAPFENTVMRGSPNFSKMESFWRSLQ